MRLVLVAARLCLATFFSSIQVVTYAQSAIVKPIVDSLFQAGIDTVIVFTPPTSPVSTVVNDSCVIYEREYLIWQNDSAQFLGEYFHCVSLRDSEHFNIALSTRTETDFFHLSYLRSHFHSITTEKLHRAVVHQKKNGHWITEDYSKIEVSDDAVAIISICLKNGKTLTNWYGENDLNNGEIKNPDGSLRVKGKSIYYTSNLKKPLYRFIQLIQESIKQLKSQGRF